jgi:hypothetical protein
MNIVRAFRDKRVFAGALGDLSSWQTWLAVLSAAFALPLSSEQMQLFAAVSGGRLPPTKLVRELWIVAGRRSGKSRMAALVALFIALFVEHRKAPGERPMVLVISGSVEQAATVFSYIKGFIEYAPALMREAVSMTRHEIELKNGVVLAVHANSYRTVRGRTICACVFDEVSFWKDENSALPDIEMYRAVLPALINGGILVGISTPYRKFGLLHQKWRDHFGYDGDDVLVVQGASQRFNATLSDAAIAAQREVDPAAAVAEWDAIFRDDISSFLIDADVDGAIDHDRPSELPPQENIVYRAFCDMSGGGSDASTLNILHRDGDRYVSDVARGWRGPHNPHQAAAEFAALAKSYRIRTIWGDNYAKEWVAGTYRELGLEYRKSPLPKSDLYLEALVQFRRGLVRIPPDPILVRELRLLERTTGRSGKDVVAKPRGEGSHDDYANALCGALFVAVKAATVIEPKIVMPFFAMRPRSVPGGPTPPLAGSVFSGASAPVGVDSPHKPSSSEDWYPYVVRGGYGW